MSHHGCGMLGNHSSGGDLTDGPTTLWFPKTHDIRSSLTFPAVAVNLGGSVVPLTLCGGHP